MRAKACENVRKRVKADENRRKNVKTDENMRKRMKCVKTDETCEDVTNHARTSKTDENARKRTKTREYVINPNEAENSTVANTLYTCTTCTTVGVCRIRMDKKRLMQLETHVEGPMTTITSSVIFSAPLHGWYYMVFVTIVGEEYDKVFNHLDMLNAPFKGKVFTCAKQVKPYCCLMMTLEDLKEYHSEYFIHHCETKEYHSECSGKISKITCRTLVITCELNGVQ
nr:hypothetical protein [Tanacetum cinerariifolium]